MEVISSVLNWFSSNILQNPAFFVGLLVLIGYALFEKTCPRRFLRVC